MHFSLLYNTTTQVPLLFSIISFLLKILPRVKKKKNKLFGGLVFNDVTYYV